MHELAFSRARSAYERDHVLGGVRGILLAVGLAALAFTLHTRTPTAVAMAAVLAATLGALGWRGGAWRRGAFAGVLAGVPPMIAPIAVAALAHGGHCTACGAGPSWVCTIACFGTSGIVGLLVGASATTDRAPRSFAIAATATAAVTGLLGCATMGFGGALGVVAGLVAGGVTGWLTAPRATAS
ncbi:hypothetical protein BH11MYX2_BH11MYX2_25350 [soil metagenome]